MGDDADRLRHIADEPGIMPFLHDMFAYRGLKRGHDSLEAIRDLIDNDMDDKANKRGVYAE